MIDRLKELRSYKKLEPLLEGVLTPKRLELGMYLVFGFLSTAVNIGLFKFQRYLNIDYKIANLTAIVFAKLFAFTTNKFFVFRSRTTGFRQFAVEFARFISGRIFTGLLDYFGMILRIEALDLPEMGSKYALQVVVIILNYFFAKIAFRRKKTGNGSPN